MNVMLDINSVVSILGFLLTIGGGFIAWGKLTTELKYLKENVSKIETRFDIRFDSFENRFSKVDEKFDSLLEKFGEKTSAISERVVKLETWRESSNNLAQANSPLKLTEKGKKILEDSGGKKYVEDHCDYLIDQIKQRKPTTAYDIQILAIETAKQFQDSDDFKNYAFETGIYTDDIGFVMGIYLRNKAIKKLGFKIKDID